MMVMGMTAVLLSMILLGALGIAMNHAYKTNTHQ